MRSYLFKSTRASVIESDIGSQVTQAFDGIESSGIDPTTLTILESILSGEDFYNIHERGEYEVIKKYDKNSDNIHLFVSSSKNLIKHLKKLTSEQKKHVLEEWCATQEMTLYGWTPETAEKIIDWLISTSKNKKCPEETIILFMETDQSPVSI